MSDNPAQRIAGPAPWSPADDAGYRELLTGVVALPDRRDVVLVEGPDALSYLQGQCSQDIEALADGAAAEALLLSPQGKLQALVRVTRLAADRLAVDVDHGYGEAVVRRLLQFRLRVKVEVTTVPWQVLSLRGPLAPSVVPAGDATAGTVAVLPWGFGGVTGVDLLGPAPRAPEGLTTVSPAVAEAVRVELGIPKMGAELDERTIPAEADLPGRAVSFTKGCYTGQELVARMDARGNRVARRLLGVVLATSPAEVAPTAGWELRDEGGPVGQLTTVAWSPGLGRLAALGYLHRRVEPPATVDAAEPGSPGPAVVAEVRRLPLVEVRPPDGT